MFVIVAAVGLAASWLAVEFLPLPFVWIFAGWFVFFIRIVRRSSGTASRIIGINVAAVLFVFLAGELLYVVKAKPWKQPETETQATAVPASEARDPAEPRAGEGWSVATAGPVQYRPSLGRYIQDHEYLGYAPLPDNRVEARRYGGDQLLYEVVYDIDSQGLRRAPEWTGADDADCVLFFGGSFTIGEGVKGEETMAHRVDVRTGERYRAYNFGFHGYGPHQMLSALEHGIVEDTIDCRPKYVFYQAIRAHVNRSAGLSGHDRHGPRYRLQADGSVRFDGRFDAEPVRAEEASDTRSPAWRRLSRSFLVAEMHRLTVVYSAQTDLLAAIADAARERVETRWPGSEFHVILWNERIQWKSQMLEKALVARNLSIHRVGEIIADYFDDKNKYRIHEDDHHPNALAHERIADYIVRDVLAE